MSPTLLRLCLAFWCFLAAAQQYPHVSSQNQGRGRGKIATKIEGNHPGITKGDKDGKGKGPGKNRGKGRGPGMGALMAPVNASTDGPGGAERPFVYNHVAKTGGSFVKNVLAELFGPKATILQEWDGMKALTLPTEGPKRPFVMGAMRYPCEYYASLWAFSSGGISDKVVGSLPSLQQYLGKDKEANFSTPEDIGRFRKWVRELSGPEFNILSTRVWFSYFKARNPCLAFEGKVCVGTDGLYAGMAEEIRSDLSAMKVDKMADCWIQTTDLEAGLEACLTKYEKAVWVPIQWPRFFELKRTRHKNRSSRVKCSEYYDENTMSFVMERDKLIVEKFGYQTCCPPDPVEASKDEL